MIQRLFVDTGGWVAYFDRSDKDHPLFKACLSQAVSGDDWRLHTSDYVMDETVTFLRYHTNHSAACTALDRFRELTAAGLLVCHEVDAPLRQQAESIFRQYGDQSFSFTDCTSFALCQTHQIHHVATGDSDFRLFGFLLVPEDISP